MFENRSSNADTKLVLGEFLLMACQGIIQNKPSSFRIFQSKSFHVNSGNNNVNQKFLPVSSAVLFFLLLHSLYGGGENVLWSSAESVILDR